MLTKIAGSTSQAWKHFGWIGILQRRSLALGIVHNVNPTPTYPNFDPVRVVGAPTHSP